MCLSIKKLSRLIAAIAVAAIVALPLVGCSYDPSPDILPHLIETPEESPERPINSRPEHALSALPADGQIADNVYRERINELYMTVVDDGLKPVFADNDPVKPVYDAAIEILDRYILNSWHDGGEYNIVHTVHDYLVANVKYDHELYDEFQKTPGMNVDNNPAFNIDGVFINKLSVCDGLSRALCFLLAIEGVESMRVTGSYASVPHAWNRVKVDGKWYNVDVTADSADYRIAGDPKFYKQVSHGFFMLSDNTYRTFNPDPATMRNHVFSGTTSVAIVDHDYYSNKMVTVGDKSYPCVVTSAEALKALFADINSLDHKLGKIELKLNFPEKTNVNNGDVYAEEIAAAYALLDDPDFNITATSKPYFQYPNGVYMFLMYK